MYHYAGNNPVKYTDPDGREDDFTPEEKKFITESQDQVVADLGRIISELKGDKGSNYSTAAKDYLGIDISNKSAKEKLINSLDRIRADLSSMTIKDYSRSEQGMKSYVNRHKLIYPSGKIDIVYDKDIYLDYFLTDKDLQRGLSSPLTATLVHETSHKALHTEDIGYSWQIDLIRRIPNSEKINNADNWAGFYRKVTGK